MPIVQLQQGAPEAVGFPQHIINYFNHPTNSPMHARITQHRDAADYDAWQKEDLAMYLTLNLNPRIEIKTDFAIYTGNPDKVELYAELPRFWNPHVGVHMVCDPVFAVKLELEHAGGAAVPGLEPRVRLQQRILEILHGTVRVDTANMRAGFKLYYFGITTSRADFTAPAFANLFAAFPRERIYWVQVAAAPTPYYLVWWEMTFNGQAAAAA